MLYLRSCHTASLTTMQESYSQAVLKVQATPRAGQNDRLPSDALTEILNGDSPLMFDFTQTMVLIKVLLLSFNLRLRLAFEFKFTSEYKFFAEYFYRSGS